MKKARIINGAVWTAIGVTLTTMVCYYWKQLGCGWDSLAVGIFEYVSFTLAFWFAFDNGIKERHQNK